MSDLPQDGQASALVEQTEITPEMIEAGKGILYNWGMDYRGDSRTLISDELVVEIFGAMVAAKEFAVLGSKRT